MNLNEPLGSQASDNSRENENLNGDVSNFDHVSEPMANLPTDEMVDEIQLEVLLPLGDVSEESSEMAENTVEQENVGASLNDEIPAEHVESGLLNAGEFSEEVFVNESVIHADSFSDFDLSESEAEEESEVFHSETFEPIAVPDEKYHNLNRLELVVALEELVQLEDFQYIRSHVGYIRAAFRKLSKEEARIDSIGTTTDIPEDIPGLEIEGQPADPLTMRFERAFEVYKEKKHQFDQVQERQKHENLKIKKQIIEELRSLIESDEELKKTYDVFREIREKWSVIGPVPQSEKNELWNNFHFLVERFFDKVKINKELKDLDLKKNLEQKTALCEKAEELLLESSIIKTFQKLQKLHEAWREIGPVATDKKEEIWDRFRAATEKLNRRRQEFYEVTRKDQSKNYEAKLELCEKAELLAASSPDNAQDWQKLTDQINEMFEAWKKIGFAPKKVNNEVWNRFRSALDIVFKNRKEFFQKYKENQTENYNKKINLCLQAEALKDSTEWKRTSNELIALQNEWKKIGPVPSKFSDKIWKRFRNACDEFFRRKSEFFSGIDEAQEDNLKRKKEIIFQLKNYSYTENNSENLKVINEFQKQYMEIGHVPIKVKDKIQLEYRTTIDDLFDKLGISRKAKSTNTFKSKVESLKNSPNADQALYKERTYIVRKISELQHEIKVLENNIGFFASSKKADILKQEFEEKIEKTRQEINHLEEKLKIIRES